MSRSNPSIMPTIGRLSCFILAGTLAGCIFVVPPDQMPATPAPAPPPLAAETETAPPALPAEPAPGPVTARPEPPPEPLSVPEPRPSHVIVLLPADLNGFAPVLADLELRLRALDYEITRVNTGNRAALNALEALTLGRPAAETYVVAVGSEAATIAIEDLGLPTVFCQVPDREFVSGGEVHGVATRPPLELQLRAWKELDPTLNRIGVILSSQKWRLAQRARQSAAAIGVTLALQTASSDQEALYLFKRLAPEIDGLWLLPDNAILSPRVIEAMLDHANRHGVQTLVFTPALLDWGALMSTTSTSADLAWTLVDVIEQLADGNAEEVPPITALSELEVRVNLLAAERLGLDPPAPVWVVRGEDR